MSILRRIAYAISFLIVAGVAAYVSYNHIRTVAVLGHQPGLVAQLLPLAVDGSMLICTLAMAEDKAANRHPRGWARFGFWFGAAVSVTANVAATAVEHPDPLSIGVAALAPVFLLISVEVVSRPGKPKGETISNEPAISVVVAQPPAQPVVVAPAPAEAPEIESAISAELESPEPEGTQPPAPAAHRVPRQRRPRGDYGPRDGEEYAERTERRKRTGR